MVSIHEGPEAVRRYVLEQAGRGLEYVRSLLQADRDALLALVCDLSEEEARFKPSEDEFSALEVLQHLGGSSERSIDRLRTLSAGRPWQPRSGGPAGPGSIPENPPASFDDARRSYFQEADAALAVLAEADGSRGLELTAPHAAYGDFNWLQWAVYSYDVHLRDHIGQVTELRRQIVVRRGARK